MEEDFSDVSDLTIGLEKQSSRYFSGYAICRQKALESHFGSDVLLFWLSLALSYLRNLSVELVPYMHNTWHLSPSDTMNFK